MAILATVVLCGWVGADEAPKAAQPSTPAAINASNNEALSAAVNKEATVEGTVSSAQWIASGKVFLVKFKDAESSQFQGVVFAKNKEAMEKGLGSDLSAALNGAKIQLMGKVVMYHEHPEIILNDPAQVTTLSKGTGVASPAAESEPVKLFGPYSKLTVSAEQRQKIAAIQKEAYDAEKALEEKLRNETDSKIDALLTDAQRKQLADLKSQATSGVKSADKD